MGMGDVLPEMPPFGDGDDRPPEASTAARIGSNG